MSGPTSKLRMTRSTVPTALIVTLTVIIALFNARFALVLAPAMAALFLFGAALAAYEWRRSATQQDERNLQVPAVNPLQLPTAVTFAVIFVVVSLMTQWIRTAFGQTGVLVLAAIVGITDIDPFVINIAQGGVAGLSITALSAAILIAASANNVAKAAYAVGFGGAQFSRRPAALLLILAVAGFAMAAIYLLWP